VLTCFLQILLRVGAIKFPPARRLLQVLDGHKPAPVNVAGVKLGVCVPAANQHLRLATAAQARALVHVVQDFVQAQLWQLLQGSRNVQ
jgi:hypothetical protein